MSSEADGRVVLLTGATSGIGRAAAIELGDSGATVLVHGRDRERGQAVVDRVREETPGDATLYTADFADLAAVRDLAGAVRDDHDRLDVLVNNAGCSRGERHVHEPGGTPVEETFLVNHLAPYLLTHELSKLLVESAPARVVTTASAVHPRGELALDDLALRDRGYDAMAAYARSKLANVLFAFELADRLAETDVTATAYHPGFVPGTALYRDTALHVRLFTGLASLLPLVGRSTATGGEGLARLAVASEFEDASGVYFDGTEPREPDGRAHDAALRERLWTVSADLVGVDADWP